MKENSFFKTKEGGLTIAFIVIMVAFAVILLGLQSSGDSLCIVGFLLIIAAMLYSPIRVFVFDRRKK